MRKCLTLRYRMTASNDGVCAQRYPVDYRGQFLTIPDLNGGELDEISAK